MFTVRVTKDIGSLLNVDLNSAQTAEVGRMAVTDMKSRLSHGLNANDTPMPGYSNKPQYISVSGGAGRAASSLKGYSISAKALGNLTAYGLTVVDLRNGLKNVKSNPKYKQKKKTVIRLKKTAKFQNRASFKRSIGKTGVRDLWVTGKLQRAIHASRGGKNSVTVEISDPQEVKVALGQFKSAGDWFGVSPSSVARISRMLEKEIVNNMTKRKIND